VSIKITHIDLYPGDSVFLQLEGSTEHSIFVRVNKTGKFLVSGPNNNKTRSYEVRISGVRRISKREANKD